MYINDNFLLRGKTAQELYRGYAKQMPVIDYHCHVNAGEIAENLHYDNITQAWISLDHYKWTAMRSCGIEEKYITAEGSDKEKFLAWAEVLPKCIGNPLYHRSHMELKDVFGFDKTLSPETAQEAWEVCNRALQICLSGN
ncbi:hypothetical protein DXA13_10315 [Clostridium sp. AM58-1XD]|nr:hypothetical protein DXA13_10315 [Clostridium sp. AM58-1XD]